MIEEGVGGFWDVARPSNKVLAEQDRAEMFSVPPILAMLT